MVIMNFRQAAFCPLVALAIWAVPTLAGQNQASPFVPAGPISAPPEQPSDLELVGVIKSGKDTLVGITNTRENKSVWIPLGKTVAGIEVVSHNPKNDTVVVRTEGQLKTLSLRAPTIQTASANPTALPTAPIAPQLPLKPLTTQAEQEREARMLVSDLLEIGMQQRKAYEEAQRKAAQQRGQSGSGSSGVQPAK
jgi:hypothetical protein